MAKRGLFQTIFGSKGEKTGDFHAYKLLSSWESTFTPYSGNIWDINTVRAAVDAFARRASTAQPRHVRISPETTVSVNDYIDRILQYKPNPYMTAADFYYKLAAQYKVFNNAIAYPVYDETGRLTAVYPINAQYFELLEYMGVMYCRFRFATGQSYICEYSKIIHVRRHFLENDIFGDGNEPIGTALKTANTFNQSMSKFAELVAVVRGILKVSNAVKTEDLNKRRDDFIRDNLRIPPENVVRHYDVTGKWCPRPFMGDDINEYYGTSGNEQWAKFKARLSENEEVFDMDINEARAKLTSCADTGDTPSEWAREAAEYCKQKGIFNGDGAGNYGWQQPITREAVAQIIYNALEQAGVLNAIPDKR